MRINKYLADCGVASRRKCDELIAQGKVKVNGKVVRELGLDIKPTDVVLFENRAVRPSVKRVYYKLHKPKGYVTTASDEKGRKTVVELMRKVQERIYPIGRLDYDTEGLLILTNDGDITNILTHPKNNVKKTYIASVEGEITPADIKQISKVVPICPKFISMSINNLQFFDNSLNLFVGNGYRVFGLNKPIFMPFSL